MTLLPQSCIRVTKSGIPSRMAIAVRPSSGTTARQEISSPSAFDGNEY